MSFHTANQTSAFLTGQNVELMGRPPYCHDLAPNDFFLFPRIKRKICGHRLTLSEKHGLEVS